MKTKPKLRARRMWANYYPTGIVCHPLRRMARINAPANCLSAAIPVAVIPLDNVDGLRKSIRDAINFCFDGENDYQTCLDQSTDAALTAIGVLPTAKKKGRK